MQELPYGRVRMYRFNESSTKAKAVQNLIEAWKQKNPKQHNVRKMAMVDVSGKAEIFREATATGTIKLKVETINLITTGKIAKGDPLYTAKIAGVLAAKKNKRFDSSLSPVAINKRGSRRKSIRQSTVRLTATVKTKAQTGVEMEALTAVSVALLTVWDMTKQYEKDCAGQYPSTAIENIHVVRKFKQA